jgi:hypothetical protein
MFGNMLLSQYRDKAASWMTGVTLSHIQWVVGALAPGIKWLGHKANHSLPPSAEVKNA